MDSAGFWYKYNKRKELLCIRWGGFDPPTEDGNLPKRSKNSKFTCLITQSNANMIKMIPFLFIFGSAII